MTGRPPSRDTGSDVGIRERASLRGGATGYPNIVCAGEDNKPRRWVLGNDRIDKRRSIAEKRPDSTRNGPCAATIRREIKPDAVTAIVRSRAILSASGPKECA